MINNMKTKYYYNKYNGFVYRVSDGIVDMLAYHNGLWLHSFFYSHNLTSPFFEHISPKVVKFFEKDGGYIAKFRDL